MSAFRKAMCIFSSDYKSQQQACTNIIFLYPRYLHEFIWQIFVSQGRIQSKHEAVKGLYKCFKAKFLQMGQNQCNMVVIGRAKYNPDSWDAVYNINKNRMQGFSNPLDLLYIQMNKTTLFKFIFIFFVL